MRKLVLALVAATVLVVAGVSAGATYRGVEATVLTGNAGCADVSGLSYKTQIKFTSPVNGSSAGGVYLFVDGNNVGWYTLGDILLKAVLVKGGPNTNAYRYPAFQDYSDGFLVPPTNPKTKKPYDLGSVTVCY
jgi:hypothetical protein